MSAPKELLELLSKNADPRKVKSLKVIHEVCEEQRRRGSVDFSVATIGRLSTEQGGPGAGAIRNSTGEAYRALIKAHLDSAGGKKPKSKPHKADENPFEGVTDPVLRARIGMLIAENESLKGQLHAARNLASHHSTVELRTEVSTVNTPLFSHQEIESAKHALISLETKDSTLKLGVSGRVCDERGKPLFKAGFASILKKVANAST